MAEYCTVSDCIPYPPAMDSALERHCSELVARERSGHTAVVEENLLYVWGGYMSVADDEVFLPNDEIWVYDLEQGVWEVFHMSGDVPPSMSGTCGCFLNGHMYIFGGCDDNGQTNQIYCVNLTDGKYTWRKIMHEIGSAPSPRDKLSCWVHNGRIIYFGGYGHKLLTDVDSRNRSFIVDEASWVMFFIDYTSVIHQSYIFLNTQVTHIWSLLCSFVLFSCHFYEILF